ncbi:MAG: transcription antitermination factor NusB [Candidatus Marinimicrobia bacterium]|jgi:N utilization substance protein B|nr:transcription antitermination factor NusB [Candidatus Neomarinimicrobiota bacterium]MDP6499430.1 transcription antitermination factor NusB [Candidatus Neomarinimicrobiota bacterium]MDP6725868.1 transcription antitermination factor NusB [Candidatus Neomarinimicrobiota bacterium]|tara:strand:- start:14066 stop:14500 length:435 start_codon:yes stop_codon:yes gene_type:complete
MHPRRKARIGVLEAVYAESQIHEKPEKILKDIFLRDEYGNGNKEFIRTLFLETISQTDECDKLIDGYLKNWEFNRIALLDKLILRMAITEMIFINDTPPKVVISEAIEIAKEYSTDESSSFVNGILDTVYKHSKLKKSKQVKAG